MRLVTIAAAGLLTLAACGSGTSTATSRTVTPPTQSTTPATTPATTPSTMPATTPVTPPASPGACDQGLWAHIYHPRRLQVISACKTVTGTVEEIRQEPDGDLHILLRLDPAYADLINTANTQFQHGDLVLEEICIGTVTQADAVAACQNFTPPAEPALAAGDHVQVTGSYVLDGVHGWTEIHPVSQVSVGP